MRTNKRSEAAFKAAETRLRKRAEELAKYRREHYQVYNSEEFLTSYPTASNTIDEVLHYCVRMVTGEEDPLPGVVVWLDGELVGAAKPGDDGEAVLTVYHGPYAGWRKVLPN